MIQRPINSITKCIKNTVLHTKTNNFGYNMRYIHLLNKGDKTKMQLKTCWQNKRFTQNEDLYHPKTMQRTLFLSANKYRKSYESEEVRIRYIGRDDECHDIIGKVGDNVMYLAHHNDLDIEGACEASLACCTCHVYVENDFYDKLPEPEEEEEDMLDLAPFLQENSRLSCQIILNKDINGIVVRLPSATRNFYVDGHKPSHH